MPRGPQHGSQHDPDHQPTLPAGIEAKELGRLLRERRVSQKLSVRQAAEAAGVSFSTLSRVEAGAQPDLTTFLNLTAWLGLSPEEFLRPTPIRQQRDAVDAVAQHLMADPSLPKDAAEQIVTVVREMYRALASRRNASPASPPLALHLRAASIMRPGVPERLAQVLQEMNRGLRRSREGRLGARRRPTKR
jgi:transcriptional regulator with XRE-family HTH domain